MMEGWKLLFSILTENRPPVQNLRQSYEELADDGLSMGTFILGMQGTGKTTALARHLVEYLVKYPERAVFVLDWSGSITDVLLGLILAQPEPARGTLLGRVIYDELGHPELAVPLPEFAPEYGFPIPEQAQRVARNLVRLHEGLAGGAPFLAGESLKHLAPAFFQLLAVTRDENGQPWQVTEAKRLIVEEYQLRRALALFGASVPEAKWHLERAFLRLEYRERHLHSLALLSVLSEIEADVVQARLGGARPGWTPREAIQNGSLVIVNGARMINQASAQAYLFTQVYSLILAEINRRIPADPRDQPVSLVLDEVYALLSIPGMAQEIGRLAPQYRSRKLQLYVVLQSLAQLASGYHGQPGLREQIWSLGNVLCFRLSNFDEAREVAQQLFPYNPRTTKQVLFADHTLAEPEGGQYTQIANWIQHFRFRQCILRRYRSEQQMDRHILHTSRTIPVPTSALTEPLDQLKLALLKRRAVTVKGALEAVRARKLQAPPAQPRKL